MYSLVADTRISAILKLYLMQFKRKRKAVSPTPTKNQRGMGATQYEAYL
jgi:hypothetical protein